MWRHRAVRKSNVYFRNGARAGGNGAGAAGGIFAALETQIAEISGLRDYSRRITSRRDGELDGVVKAINILLSEVEARDEQLKLRLDELTDARDDAQTSNILLRRVKDDLRSRKIELDDALARAAQASNAKSQFLANMSHEIRTPMNGILGMAELLARSNLDQKQRSQVATIVQSGRALLTIINDILDFSKIESGQLSFDNKPFDLKTSIDDVATLLTPNAERKKLKLLVDYDPALPRMLIGDAGRLRQIVTNITGNSVKFTEQGSVSIKVRGQVEQGAANLRIEITDTGIGIPADKVGTVFEKFSQIDGTSTRRHEGTGLGLSICKLLSERMGGTIGATSVLGQGSTFWFQVQLPVHVAAAARPSSEGISLNDKKILVIQADERDHPPLIEQIKGFGCQVTVAEDAKAAINLGNAYGAVSYDLAILSADTGDDYVIRHARQLRTCSTYAEMPIALLVSIGAPGEAKSADDAGLQAYLTRPLSGESLAHAMREIIAHRIAGSSALITKHSIEETVSKSVSGPAASRTSARRVLLVEDSLVNQEVAREFLDGIECTVEVANNGAEAVKAVSEGVFDVVLMDCQMPVMDGFEATRRIREHEQNNGLRPVPIVALTANAFASDREKCAAAGMSDFLSKPFMPDEFEATVLKWLDAPQS